MVNKLKIMLVVALFMIPAVATKENFYNTQSKEVVERVLAVKKSISKLAPHLSNDRQLRVAAAIYSNSIKYKISKKVLLSIIKIESNFKSNAVSSTGDYSIVQINLKIWNKEFARLGMNTIDKNMLIKSDEYAIKKMCIILNIIKSRKPKDPKWYARYHSNTPEFNNIYKLKIDKIMERLASN